jgi:hypothetical protein
VQEKVVAGKRGSAPSNENDLRSFSRAKKPNASLDFELLLVCKGSSALSASSALF